MLSDSCADVTRYVCEFYARGKSYEEVHEQNRARSHLWEKYIEDTSFKFLVTAFNHTIPQWRQKDVVESFSYMGEIFLHGAHQSAQKSNRTRVFLLIYGGR